MPNSSGELASSEAILSRDSVGSASKEPRLRFPHAMAGYFCAGVDFLVIIVSSILGCSIYQAFSGLVVSNFDAFALSGSVAAILYLWMAHAARDLPPIRLHCLVTCRLPENHQTLACRRSFTGPAGASRSRLARSFRVVSIVAFVALTATLLLVARWAVTRAIKVVVSEGLLAGRRAVLVGSRDGVGGAGRRAVVGDFGLSEIDRLTLPSPSLSTMQLTRSELSVLNPSYG